MYNSNMFESGITISFLISPALYHKSTPDMFPKNKPSSARCGALEVVIALQHALCIARYAVDFGSLPHPLRLGHFGLYLRFGRSPASGSGFRFSVRF